MKLIIGCDINGVWLKLEILEALKTLEGIEATDIGVAYKDTTPYPLIAEKIAMSVAKGENERGILICGTGIGMALTANKVKGAYAAVCHDIYSTRRSILSNNANILCMGGGIIGKELALAIVKEWLSLQYKDSPSTKKIELYKAIEEQNFK
jgi:ribose 5-phosphate isomerase B